MSNDVVEKEGGGYGYSVVKGQNNFNPICETINNRDDVLVTIDRCRVTIYKLDPPLEKGIGNDNWVKYSWWSYSLWSI